MFLIILRKRSIEELEGTLLVFRPLMPTFTLEFQDYMCGANVSVT